MAKLPGTARRDLNGAQISTVTVRPTDLGLGALGDAMQAFDQSEDRIAEKRAREAVRDLDTRYNDAYGRMEAEYDRSSPGFAKTATDTYDGLAVAARTGLSEREQRFFDEFSSANRAQRMQRAADVENTALGGIVREQRDAVRSSDTAAKLTQFNIGVMQALSDDERGNAMLAPDYEQTATARFDEQAQALIDGAPEWQKADLTNQVTQMRSKMQLDLRGKLINANEVAIRENTTNIISGLINAVRINPSHDAFSTAMIDGAKAINSLPLPARAAALAALPDTYLSAMAQGFVDNQDAYGLEAFMKDEKFNAVANMRPDNFARYQGQVASIKASAAQVAAAQALEQDMQDELTRIAVTGQGASLSEGQFIKSYGPIKGPVQYRAYTEAVKEAKSDFGLTKMALMQTSSQYAETISALKPADNDPDYARNYARWQRALDAGSKVFAARQADGAGAALAIPDMNAQWQAVQSGTPGAAEKWANSVISLQKQWGHSPELLSVLPSNYATALVKGIKKAPPDQKDEMLAQAWNTLGNFGRYGGLGLRDLHRAGLEATDVAVLNQTQGDPVALAQYTYLTGRAAQTKLDKSQTSSLNSAVDDAFDDYVATWGYSADGKAFGANLKQVAYQMAKGLKADGKDDQDAARETAKLLFEQRYAVSDKLKIRIPRAVANQKQVRVKVKGGLFAQPRETDGVSAISLGLMYIKTDLELGRRQFQGRQTSPNLTPEQELERERAQIKDNGVWLNTEDDSGAMLSVPVPGGGYRAVFGADGKPIVITWDQAQRHAWEGL